MHDILYSVFDTDVLNEIGGTTTLTRTHRFIFMISYHIIFIHLSYLASPMVSVRRVASKKKNVTHGHTHIHRNARKTSTHPTHTHTRAGVLCRMKLDEVRRAED